MDFCFRVSRFNLIWNHRYVLDDTSPRVLQVETSRFAERP
jgi:hypothetical protein